MKIINAVISYFFPKFYVKQLLKKIGKVQLEKELLPIPEPIIEKLDIQINETELDKISKITHIIGDFNAPKIWGVANNVNKKVIKVKKLNKKSLPKKTGKSAPKKKDLN